MYKRQLYYYGGLRCLATLDLENQEGIQAAVRMVSATSFDEALDLFGRRNVTWVVIPSWDTQLDTFAQLGLGQIERSFINSLHHWSLPPWLRPVAYPLPADVYKRQGDGCGRPFEITSWA